MKRREVDTLDGSDKSKADVHTGTRMYTKVTLVRTGTLNRRFAMGDFFLPGRCVMFSFHVFLSSFHVYLVSFHVFCFRFTWHVHRGRGSADQVADRGTRRGPHPRWEVRRCRHTQRAHLRYIISAIYITVSSPAVYNHSYIYISQRSQRYISLRYISQRYAISAIYITASSSAVYNLSDTYITPINHLCDMYIS
jgi:hypothetical protein